MIELKGIGVSGGVGIARALVISKDDVSVPKRKIRHDEISREIYRLEEALIAARREISTLQKKISKEIGFDHGKIFEAHYLVLEDRVLIEDVINQIKNNKINVEYAFSQSIKRYVDTLLKLNDDYLRERVVDIEDIARRVLKMMLKEKATKLSNLEEKAIIIAHDLSPSQTASLPKEKIVGFVTDIGGKTSHTAIIARTLRIPAVVGVEVATENIETGDRIIVDGSTGKVVIRPTDNILKEYQKKSTVYTKEVKAIHIPKALRACTVDKREIVVSSNIELPEEIPFVKKYGAEGIGLYRTEFMFLGRVNLPTEEEQYEAYSKVAKEISPHSVIFRTIDIGGDKFLSQPRVPKEMSPFLGWRAIRFCLARPEIFKVQLKAMLRASAVGNVKIMFPMISGIEELRQARQLLKECKEELNKENKKFDERIPVGAMIEVPSAALTADILAKESDFFSIGTNDLIQYSLAVDRSNEKVAYLYEPGHPAVLRLIKKIIEVAHSSNIWVGMCGEMSGEPIYTLLLLGMGLDRFSMSAPQIPKIKELINNIRFSDAKKIMVKVLELSTPKEVEKCLQEELKKILREDLYHTLMI
jgi:phosphotransferase system enzyme I (PtsI)